MKWQLWELELLAKQDDFEGEYSPEPLPEVSLWKMLWQGFVLGGLGALVYGVWRWTR